MTTQRSSVVRGAGLAVAAALIALALWVVAVQSGLLGTGSRSLGDLARPVTNPQVAPIVDGNTSTRAADPVRAPAVGGAATESTPAPDATATVAPERTPGSEIGGNNYVVFPPHFDFGDSQGTPCEADPVTEECPGMARPLAD